MSEEVEELSKRVGDLELYRASHEARINEKWDNQEAVNKGVFKWMEKTGCRLTGLEKRVLLLSAIAAGAGGTAGSVVSALFGGG